jgi:hypothetical protein
MWAIPAVSVVARPLWGEVLLMVATLALSDAQVTVVVTSCLELSAKVPVAVNGCGVPTVTLGDWGAIAIDTSAASTVSVVSPLMLPLVAVMVVVPAVIAVALPPLAIVATAVVDEAQVTCVVRSWWLPSLYVPVAANCSLAALAIWGCAGVTAIDWRVAPEPEPDPDPVPGLELSPPPPPPQPARTAKPVTQMA